MSTVFIDLTVVFNQLTKSWVSRFPALHDALTISGKDVLPQLARAHAADYKEYHMSIKTMTSRIQSAAWQAKFKDQHVVLLFDYYSEFLKKYVPSYLMTGRHLILVQALYGCVHTLQCPPTEDMSDVYDTVNAYLDELNFKWAESESKRLCAEEQCRANLTREAAVTVSDSVYAKRGPITLGQLLRKTAPTPEEMLAYVTELAPLYDIDAPSTLFSLPQYENMRQYNPDPTMAKFLRPTRTVMSPHFRQVFLECPAAIETVYYQIKWYVDHDIQPDYIWVEDINGTRTLCTKHEAKYLGNQTITRMSDGSPALQALFS